LFPLGTIDRMFKPLPPVPDHPALERQTLARWEDEQTFRRLREQNAGGPRFSFIDGPITANNPMGVHHAWGRTLKDVFQRYQAARGMLSPRSIVPPPPTTSATRTASTARDSG
jgi:isoleucyl-tRNA synthetase